MQSHAIPHTSLEKQRRESSFMNLGGAVVSQESVGGPENLKYSDLSLAELWQSPIG